jgi:NCS1 family nucleobase:cation symporter-1
VGRFAGIMIFDYFIIQKQPLNFPVLFKNNVIFAGFIMSGLIAFGVPVALTLFALTTGYLSWFYQYGWFTGSILGAIIYFFIAKRAA